MIKIRRLLAACLAILVMGAAVGLAAAEEGKSERLQGADRYATSVAIAQHLYPSGAKEAILARGEYEGEYADGLSASTLAGYLDAPILLTKKDILPKVVEQGLKGLNVSKVYIMGGDNAVSPAVEEAVKKLGIETERIRGDNREGTAAEIARKVAKGGSLAHFAFIVNGYAPADSLVAGTVAAKLNAPILQVKHQSIPQETRQVLKELGISQVYLVGGTSVISQKVENELKQQVTVLGRLSGEDRYETSLAFAQAMFPLAENYTIVRGQDRNLADAIGSALIGNPIVYVNQPLKDHVEQYLDKQLSPYSNVNVIGGEAAVSSAMMAVIESKMKAESLTQADLQAGAKLDGKFVIRQSGVYGPATGTAQVSGTLYLDPGASGEVTLRNVEADRIVIKSGSPNSVILDRVTASQVDVLANWQHEPVRLNITGSTQINRTTVGSSVILDRSSGSFGSITIAPSEAGEALEVNVRGDLREHTIQVNSPAAIHVEDGVTVGSLQLNADTTIGGQGQVSQITVTSSNAHVQVTGGQIGTLEVANTAAGAVINVAQGTAVGALVLNSSASIDGAGSIDTVIIASDGVVLDNPPANVIILEGVTAIIGGQEQTGTIPADELNRIIEEVREQPPVPQPEPPAGGGGGDQGGSPPDGPTLPEVSTYAFHYTLPEVVEESGYIPAGQDVSATVSLKTDQEGSKGYEKVLIEFEVTEAPDDSTVTFKAKDSLDKEHTFTNGGHWGPPDGFELPARYQADTTWTLNFSHKGQYTIAFRLIDRTVQGGNSVIVSEEVTVYVGPVINITENTGYDTIQDAIDAARRNDTIFIAARNLTVVSQIAVRQPITIEGNGTVIQADPSGSWPDENDSKHLMNVMDEGVTIKNITLDSNHEAYGLQFYKAEGYLENVTIKNSQGAGLTVNGSAVVAEQLTTEGNVWGGVNVDPGKNVERPSTFKLISGELKDPLQIWSDGKNVTERATVDVIVPADYQAYRFSDGVKIWTNRDLENVAVLVDHGTEENVIYSSIGAAIAEAEEGDTILVKPGLYQEALQINKSLTLIGDGEAGAVQISANGAEFAIEILNIEDGEVTIEGFTILGDWKAGGINQGRSSSATKVHIRNNIVQAPDVASAHGNSIQVSGDGSTVIGNMVEVTRLNSTNWAASGILVVNASDVVIQGNDIKPGSAQNKTAIGIAVQNFDRGSSENGMTNVTVENNTVTDVDWGISIQAFGGNITNLRITNNTVSNTLEGLSFMSNYGGPYKRLENVDVTNNSFENNTYHVTVFDQLWETIDLEVIQQNNTYIPDAMLGQDGNGDDQFFFIAGNSSS